MKRQFRQLDKETKEKISRSSKGKIKSDLHKQHISQSMRKYWSQIPNLPTLAWMNFLASKPLNKV